jgi:hypothetical protein
LEEAFNIPTAYQDLPTRIITVYFIARITSRKAQHFREAFMSHGKAMLYIIEFIDFLGSSQDAI